MTLHSALAMDREQALRGYVTILEETKGSAEDFADARRWLSQNDLFYLLWETLGRRDINHPWLFARCREVQADCSGTLDLWAREHYKSTIITFGLTIQEILIDPEITIGIFSDTNKVAKPFLRQIKREFEANEELKALFPDVFYAKPEREAPQWSEDEGIIVKRRGNPKEATVEAYGLIDGQPIGRHFALRDYDDLVTPETVGSPEMMAKVRERLALSDNLGTATGRARFAGTRYHALDAYQYLIDTGIVRVRKHPATVDGTAYGAPVLLTPEKLAEKRAFQGEAVFAAQMLLDPLRDSVAGFRTEWLRYWPATHYSGLNIYILVDPSSGRKKTSDFTAMWVVGFGADGNLYCIDLVYDRLNLGQRTSTLLDLVQKYRPAAVGYEEYGLQADIEHVRMEQDRLNFRFTIVPLGGKLAKVDRIKRLMPKFEQGRVYLPAGLIRYRADGSSHDPVRQFVEEEFKQFPVAPHDDALDALSRAFDEDLAAVRPTNAYERTKPNLPLHLLRHQRRAAAGGASWRAG
jgi:predicted phage terminase large subunit-like protein